MRADTNGFGAGDMTARRREGDCWAQGSFSPLSELIQGFDALTWGRGVQVLGHE